MMNARWMLIGLGCVGYVVVMFLLFSGLFQGFVEPTMLFLFLFGPLLAIGLVLIVTRKQPEKRKYHRIRDESILPMDPTMDPTTTLKNPIQRSLKTTRSPSVTFRDKNTLYNPLEV